MFKMGKLFEIIVSRINYNTKMRKLTTAKSQLGLIHTRHFCTQYCDKKIKRCF